MYIYNWFKGLTNLIQSQIGHAIGCLMFFFLHTFHSPTSQMMHSSWKTPPAIQVTAWNVFQLGDSNPLFAICHGQSVILFSKLLLYVQCLCSFHLCVFSHSLCLEEPYRWKYFLTASDNCSSKRCCLNVQQPTFGSKMVEAKCSHCCLSTFLY